VNLVPPPLFDLSANPPDDRRASGDLAALVVGFVLAWAGAIGGVVALHVLWQLGR
jgi:hypothetical protein